MERTLYVETNFVLGLAKGQDPAGAALLADDSHDVHVVIPSICVIESLSTWAHEQKQRKKFLEELASHGHDINRDLTAPAADALAKQCDEVKLGSERRLNYIKMRLYECLSRLNGLATMLHPDGDMIAEALSADYIDDPTDNLIYCCILRHARLNPRAGARKAFVSGNHTDFDRPTLTGPLERAGVTYFRATANALGWLRRPVDSSTLDPREGE